LLFVPAPLPCPLIRKNCVDCVASTPAMPQYHHNGGHHHFGGGSGVKSKGSGDGLAGSDGSAVAGGVTNIIGTRLPSGSSTSSTLYLRSSCCVSVFLTSSCCLSLIIISPFLSSFLDHALELSR